MLFLQWVDIPLTTRSVGLCPLPLNLGRTSWLPQPVVCGTNDSMRLLSKVVKKSRTLPPSLGTLGFAVLSWHVRSLAELKPLCSEEAQTSTCVAEATRVALRLGEEGQMPGQPQLPPLLFCSSHYLAAAEWEDPEPRLASQTSLEFLTCRNFEK